MRTVITRGNLALSIFPAQDVQPGSGLPGMTGFSRTATAVTLRRGRHIGRRGMRIGQIVLDVSPLREGKDFRLLFAGRFVSMAGNAVATTAANWQVYGLTHSSLHV